MSETSSAEHQGASSHPDRAPNNPSDGTATRIDAEAKGVNPPSNDNDPMVTRSSVPQVSDSALDMASCKASMDTDLSFETDIRGISIVCLIRTFRRLSLVFPLNVEWTSTEAVEEAAEVYANSLSDIPADECKAAIIRCAKTLTRFPFPADIRAAAGKQ